MEMVGRAIEHIYINSGCFCDLFKAADSPIRFAIAIHRVLKKALKHQDIN